MNDGRVKWAVTANGRIVHMSKTFDGARQWASLRKGIYKIRRLTDEDFETTTNAGVRS
jgi:hypothetical protein